MVLDKEQNKERMKKERAQKERAQKEEEKKEIIAGVVAAVCDVLPNMIAKHHLYQGVVPTKVSCREEAAHPVPYTPPGAMRTGGTRGRSPAVDSGNGRTKATKQEAPTPPTPPKPFTPPRTLPVLLSPLSPLSFLSDLERSTAKKLVVELVDLVDDVHKIFEFPTEEEDFMTEKKRYYK
jgi:hypothetical protein